MVECFGAARERADMRGCYYGHHEHVTPCPGSLEDLRESKEVGALHKIAQDQGPSKH